MDSSLPEDLNLQKRSKLAQPPDWFMPRGSQTPQSGTTCVPSTQIPASLTASLAVVPARICPLAEIKPALTESDRDCGGSNCESSMNADRNLLAGKMLRERSIAELEKWLPASEWSDTKSRARSSYRQRNSERHTSASEFLSLPTATTYPSGNGKVSPAGRNKLESTLRSRATIPTPTASDGTRGYNTGKTGGMSITGYLRLATPQNANSATLKGQLKMGKRLATPAARDFKGASPTMKTGASATLADNVEPFIMPTQSANPQVWGWMMGFPTNWAESVLMPQLGSLGLDDRDGGIEINRPIAPVLTASE